jgi:hypothetical protein
MGAAVEDVGAAAMPPLAPHGGGKPWGGYGGHRSVSEAAGRAVPALRERVRRAWRAVASAAAGGAEQAAAQENEKVKSPSGLETHISSTRSGATKPGMKQQNNRARPFRRASSLNLDSST